MSGGLVRSIVAGGLAERIGLRAGDRLLAIDGHPLRDSIDFQFYTAEERFRLVYDRDGRHNEVDVEREPGQEMGVAFEADIFDAVRLCNNDCLFCFLKGLPAGMRSSLYLKDDDYRLSFAHGNFITLANLTERDWRRLEEQRLSPLNISVHATEPALRRRILRNPKAPDIIDRLRRLADLGIRVNTQVVLCPGVNDGPHLQRTIDDLATLYPAVQSIGIVPVAASRHAEAAFSDDDQRATAACTPEYARNIIRQVAPRQRDFRRRLGVDLVYLADEFYLAAETRLPAAARYDGYPQYENGIGMSRALLDDWRRVKRRLIAKGTPIVRYQKVTLACGTLIAPLLRSVTDQLASMLGIEINVVAVGNRFFGPRVSVSGLLTSADIVESLQRAPQSDLFVLSRHALDHDSVRFLDDGTPAGVEAALRGRVVFASTITELLHEISA